VAIRPVAGNRKPTVEQVIDGFETLLGIGEQGTNHNIVTRWYGADGPWCAMAVSAAFYIAGGKTGLALIGGKTAATAELYYWAEHNGMIHTSTSKIPRGAVVLFNSNYKSGRPLGISHVGMCLADLGTGKIATIEGNTSDDCRKRTRSKSGVAAWFLPKYAASAQPSTVAPRPAPRKPPAKVYFWVAVVTQSATLLGDVLGIAAANNLTWRMGTSGSNKYFLCHAEGAYTDQIKAKCAAVHNKPSIVKTTRTSDSGVGYEWAKRWPSVTIEASN
jgi:hypothetical protein